MISNQSLSHVVRSERGAATAEYIVATMAAVAFASLLLAIFKSDEVRQLLLGLVRQALTVGANG